MIIKKDNWKCPVYDLLGNDEKALTKAFAHLLANSETAFKLFMKEILKTKVPRNLHQSLKVEIEKHHDDGRTDIELSTDDFHVIIEGKINYGDIKSQWTQYEGRFSIQTSQKYFVAITSLPIAFEVLLKDLKVHKTTWKDIYQVLGNNSKNEELIELFISFYERKYLIMLQKEILVQDLGVESQIDLLKEHLIYKRDKVSGIPLYFAPYITKRTGQEPGIDKLYKVLGVLFTKTDDPEWLKRVELFLNDNPELKDYKFLFGKWLDGLAKFSKDLTEFSEERDGFNIYFLDEPVELPGKIKKGAALMKQLPKNFSMSFKELFIHLNNLMTV